MSNSTKIKDAIWYQGNGFAYGKYTDILSSTNNPITAKVGLIRLGEMLSGQSSTIITNNYTKTSSYNNSKVYWTMNKHTNNSYAWDLYSTGSADMGTVSDLLGIRPVVVIRNDLSILGGNGTWNNPYEI